MKESFSIYRATRPFPSMRAAVLTERKEESWTVLG